MTGSPRRDRPLLARATLLIVIAQAAAVAGVVFALPALGRQPFGPAFIVLVTALDVGLLALFAGRLLKGSLADPVRQLAADVLRIADGDYHHRIGDTRRDELREIQESVNRLADRLIADQKLLAENVQSLEETNRELLSVRDQMVHSARLASVGTLAAGIAHEVGNPLGAITAFVDLARKRAERSGSDTEILDSIRGEAHRIDRIVRGLLDYARPRGRHEGPAAARDVVDRVRQLLESQGHLDRARVEWEIALGPDDFVTEPHRLEQVLVNLLLNGLDAVEGTRDPRVVVRLYGAEGGLHRLPPRREDDPPGVNYMHRRRLADDERGLDLVTRASRVTVLEVSDNGPGIAAEHLEHVFDPFFTTKEPGKGTGLGLSICARLVEGMGGQIEAGRAVEGGARFVIRLPGMSAGEASTVVERKSEAVELT